jgi:hypothetical protein
LKYRKLLLKTLTANGQDVRFAENDLRNLVEIQRIFEQYRLAILDATDRDRATGDTLPCETDAPN